MLAPCSWADWAVRNSWSRTNQVEEVHVYGDVIGRDRSLPALGGDSVRQEKLGIKRFIIPFSFSMQSNLSTVHEML